MGRHLSISNVTRRSRRLFALLAPAAIAAGLGSGVQAASTWTGTASSDWSISTNWDSVPASDGTADVAFHDIGTALTSSIDTAWATHGVIKSLTFNNDSTGVNKSYTIKEKTSGIDLQINGGGITQNDDAAHMLAVPLIAGATQTWNIANGAGSQIGLNINDNLTLNSGVTLTKSGGKNVQFNSGTTTVVGNGAFTLDNGVIAFGNINQFGRLGTNALTIKNTNNTSLSFNTNTTGGNFSTPVTIDSNNLAGKNHTLTIADLSGATGTAVNVTGAWSGALAGGATNGSGTGQIVVTVTSSSIGVWDDRYRIAFKGDNLNLTSTANPGATTPNSAVQVRSGILVADHINALGANNSLGLTIGQANTYVAGVQAGLLATSDKNVSSKIYVPQNGHAAARNGVAVLGLDGAGSVNFTGGIYLEPVATSALNRVQTLKLTAPANGVANFSGTIKDAATGAFSYAPVVVLGGGTVALSGNNTYSGTTSVRGGTLLLGSANALGNGSSAVSLGDTVVAPANGAVVAATTAGLPGTFSLSAAGTLTWTANAPTTLDGITLKDNDRILVKDQNYNAAQNGVYVRTSATTWSRAADLDSAGEFAQGLQVHIQAPATGTNINGGKNFYLPNALVGTLNDTGSTTTSGAFGFNPDAASDADVAMLTNAAITVARNINVTNNLSTGDSILGGNSAHASVFSGAIALSKNLAVTAATGGSVDFSGTMTGGFSVTKEGAGLVKFSNAKTYTGSTSVLAGTLEVDDTLASSAVSVASGATLKGIGTIAGTVSAVGGALAPGNSAGTMTFGGLLLDGSSILNYELDATNHSVGNGINDLIQVTGDVTLDGTLNLAILNGTDLTPGTYRLLDYTGKLTDGGLALGTGFTTPGTTYTIDTSTAGQVNLVVTVPEPVIPSLLGMAGLIVLGKRTRR